MENIKHSLHASVKCSNVTQAHLSRLSQTSGSLRPGHAAAISMHKYANSVSEAQTLGISVCSRASPLCDQLR